MATKKAAKPLSLSLVQVKATKGSIVFGEAGDDDDAKFIRSLYLPKSKLAEMGHKEGDPIKVTVEL